MTQNEEVQTSFWHAQPRDIGLVARVEDLNAIHKSQNPENWCVAWSSDSSYVAWSQGGGIVYLLPWNRHDAKLSKTPSRDRSVSDLTQLDREDPVYIQNLPRLSQPDDNLNQNHHDNENSNHGNTQEAERSCFRIDCMDNVWSMAFGSGISDNKNVNIWTRFHFKQDLILATGLQGGKIKLWNVYSGNLLLELLDHRSIVRGVSFTCDGSLKLVSCSNDCTVKFWDLNSDGNMYRTARFKENVMMFGCKWSPNVKHVAAVGMNKCAYILDVTDVKKPPLKLSGHLHNVCSCDFTPDGALVATASFDTRVIIFDVYTGDMIRSFGHMFPSPRPIYAGGANGHYVRDVSFSKNAQHLATVCDDGYLRVWNFHSDSENPECIAETTNPLSCSFSPNGHVIATGSRDNGRIEFFRPQKGQPCSLQHICRTVVRRNLDSRLVDRLHFPVLLKEYLKYKYY